MLVARSLMRSMLGGSLEGYEEEEQEQGQDDPMDVDKPPQLPAAPQTRQTRQQSAAVQTYFSCLICLHTDSMVLYLFTALLGISYYKPANQAVLFCAALGRVRTLGWQAIQR